jgi:hypothetical protein
VGLGEARADVTTRARIALFVRPAIPGRVKTRLSRHIGEDAAAMLYRAFARDVLWHARGVREAEVVAWIAGAIDDPTLDFLPADVPRFDQRTAPSASPPDPSLGERMRWALEDAIGAGKLGLVVGSDAPSIGTRPLVDALAGLSHHDVAFVPAADGGFAAVAARRTAREMFTGVRMSSSHTLQDSLRACARAGLSCALTSPCFDVDEARDLWTLRAQLDVSPATAPHSRAALQAVLSRHDARSLISQAF